VIVPATILAQDASLAEGERFIYRNLMTDLVALAEQVPGEHYTLRPAPSVRTFGQLVGHIADAQYTICSMASGAPSPSLAVEQSIVAKEPLLAALKRSIAYCDDVYVGMTNARAHELTMLAGLNHEVPRLTVLSLNTAHAFEHYGNMVTYARLKGQVPPKRAY
jgi:uncharacterized damage-inducible protein DinB